MPHFVIGIEIGGTKLQLALGQGVAATFQGFWRGQVSATAGAAAIRTRLRQAIPELLQQSHVSRDEVAGIGIAFGGPVDSQRGITLISHQVDGWQDFPIVEWVRSEWGWAATLQNDADSAALAESRYGSGRGFDPCLYLTVGSGIGGGLVIGGRIFRGSGAGALEIGHLRPGQLPLHLPLGGETVEAIASGFGITERARRAIQNDDASRADRHSQFASPIPQATGVDPEFPARRESGRRRSALLLELAGGDVDRLSTALVAQAAAAGDPLSRHLLADATQAIGWAIAQAITLINPARIVVGGGVSLMGEELFFAPVRRACDQFVFPPFRGIADIVPAQLGEEVVVHGAVAVAAAEFLEASAT